MDNIKYLKKYFIKNKSSPDKIEVIFNRIEIFKNQDETNLNIILESVIEDIENGHLYSLKRLHLQLLEQYTYKYILIDLHRKEQAKTYLENETRTTT